MAQKLGFFSILGVAGLAGFGALSHIVAPEHGKTLADWSAVHRLASISSPEAANAQLPREAHASVTDSGDDEEDQNAAVRIGQNLAKQNLERAQKAQRAVEAAVDTESAPAAPQTSAQISELTEAKRNLEAQQDTLVREIAVLKKQLREAAERNAAQEQQAAEDAASAGERTALEAQVREQRERADKEHANLKLLADHILKLRQDLKDKTAALASKETELDAAQRQLASEQQGNASRSDAEKLALTQERKKIEQERDELITRLEEAQKKISEDEASIGSLREKLQLTESEQRVSKDQLTRVKDDLTGQNEELESTQRQLSKTIEEARVCTDSLAEKTKAAEQTPALQKELDETKSIVAQRDREVADLKSQVTDREQLISNIAALKKELLASKNQLLLREKQDQLLGSAGAKKPGQQPDSPELQARREAIFETAGRNAVPDPAPQRQQPPMNTDVMVVEVVGSKVSLRSGPSPDDSELMTVGKGTTLTVEERKGEWYRVIAPNSMRAYVRSDMVRIVSGRPGGEEAEPPVRRPGVSLRMPKKRVLKAAEEDPNMEPFGDVKRDKVDRAFDQLKQGIGNAPETEKPAAPEMLP